MIRDMRGVVEEGPHPLPPRFDPAQVVGQMEADAREYLAGVGLEMRVSQRDGVPQEGTCDFRTDRLNVAVEGDVVIYVLGIQ
jgi:hypothetical protein